MKKIKIFILSILLVSILALYIFYGMPVPAIINEFGCAESYTSFLIKGNMANNLCQKRTGGHCPTPQMRLHNAKVKVAYCLCDKYAVSKNPNTELSIIQLCRDLDLYCDERFKNYYQNGDIQADAICENKELFFRKKIIK